MCRTRRYRAPVNREAMPLSCLLIGMTGGGGEEVFLRDLIDDPPPGVSYASIFGHHESIPGARSRRLSEVAFNRLVHPRLWPLPGLRAYTVDDRFDIVHVHVHLHHLRLPPGVPAVMSVSNSYWHYLRDYLGWSDAQVAALYRRAGRLLRPLHVANELVSWSCLAAISVFSEFARDVLINNGVPQRLVHVIPPGFRAPAEVPIRPSGRPFTFLFAGRDPHRKGADLVIEAVRSLRRDGLAVGAIMAGDESFAELRGEDGFEALGFVKRDELVGELYARADAFVMPSRAEGFGFTIVEAMSQGLPVISSTYGSIPEVVDDCVTGLLAEPGDGNGVERAMRTLAEDPAAARAMGQAGRAAFEARFTRERFLERTRAWYDAAIGAA